MKRQLAAFAASLVGMLAFALAPSVAQAQTKPAAAPKFALDPSWPKDLPGDWITGQVGGVCVGELDHIYIVNRRNITDEEKETSTSAPSIISGRPRARGPARPARR